MNTLIIGANKEPIKDHIPNDGFLLIDDGPFVDHVLKTRTAREFLPERDCFDPLRDMTYKKAREFVSVLDAIFPEGESTLTRRYSNFVLLEALLSQPRSLETLVPKTKDTLDAYQKIQTLLLSPVLKRVLESNTFSMKGTIVARLDRASLGDFDCFVLGNLLIASYPGRVIVPDFGFYAHKGHSSLLRQNRLTAGVTTFDEVPDLRNQLLLIEDKRGSRCTPEDAALLALYAGIPKGTNAYNDYIAGCIGSG